MKSRISLLAFALVAGVLTTPFAVHAAVPFFGPIIGDSWNACPLGWAAIINVINNIISLGITLVIVFVAPIMIAYGGFKLVINPFSSGAKEEARRIIQNTVIGVVIALASWLIVDAVMAVLYKPGDALGAWSSLVTSGGLDNCIVQAGALNDLNPASGATGSGGLQVVGTGGDGSVTATGADGTKFKFQSASVQSQLPATSPALKSLIGCMMANPNVKGTNYGQISALTDSQVGTDSSKITACAQAPKGSCIHTQYSCHYGGRTCQGQSYAVDFGDGDPQHPAALAALQSAATACGAAYQTSNENGKQTHLHVSVGSCGCDGH